MEMNMIFLLKKAKGTNKFNKIILSKERNISINPQKRNRKTR